MSRRVSAIRHGRRNALCSEHFYDPSAPDPHDAPMSVDYVLWAITGGEGPIVVDSHPPPRADLAGLAAQIAVG